MYFYGIDATYIFLVLPAVIFALWAQFNVKSTFLEILEDRESLRHDRVRQREKNPRRERSWRRADRPVSRAT